VNINGSQGPVTFVKSSSWWQRSNWDAFAPRLGLSWSPFGGDKTAIHAGYGISFDPIATYEAAAAANFVIGVAASCTATTYGSTTPGCQSVPANTRLSQGFPAFLAPPTGILPSSLLTPSADLDTAIDNNNLRLDRGRADFDQTHVIALTWIYQLPFGTGKPLVNPSSRALNAIVGGWSLQGFNSNQSGEPYSILSGAKTNNFDSNSRAVIVGNSLPSSSFQNVPGLLGPVAFTSASAFALPAAGGEGEGRNLFNGPWFWDMDASLSKTFQVTEKVKITFRMDAFNALNHANFRKLSAATIGSGANAANNIPSPNFGRECCTTIATTTTTAILSNGEPYRIAQMVLQVAF